MDSVKPDIAKWRTIIRNRLGKVCVKNALQIMLDVLSVDVGLKPAYLFDVACVSGETLAGFVEELHRQEMLRNKLSVLLVQEDVFVIHPGVCDILQKLTDDVKIVDASESLTDPALLPEDRTKEITTVIFKALQQSLTDHSESNIKTLSLPAEINIPTVFGYLLGYPVLYWSDVDSTENCLGMVPLLNYKLQFTNLLPAVSFEYTCFSFSVPKQVFISNKFDARVDLWYELVKANCTDMFQNPVLSKSEIILPYVAM